MKRCSDIRPLYAAIAILIVVAGGSRSSSAQHSDVFISVDANRIVVQNSFHADSIRSFDVLGDGTVWHGANPGYSTTGAGQFQSNDEVDFNIASPLLFSTGQGWDVVDGDHYLRQFWSVFPDLTVTSDATTGNQPGFLIGAVGHRGTVHQHHTFELATFSGSAPDEGAYAIQQVIAARGYVTSDPFWIVLNNGLPITDFATTLRSLPPIELEGDYDRNGIVDVRDINRLRDQILAAAEVSEFTQEFDLTGDSRIESVDLEYWVREIGQTWLGDVNLDGEFNATDLIQVFQIGHYDDDVPANSLWEHGDWNSDAEFDSGDLISAFQNGGYEQGPRAVTVPEPSISTAWVVFAAVVLRSISPKSVPNRRHRSTHA